ncbi:MAG: hypothetical protein SOZ84_03425 [Treponema sp.]|nr:hypothetical protein [Treponema sp.]
MGIELLIVDPQNDFCSSSGSMYIKNAEQDCQRISQFIYKHIDDIDSIHITMDMHPYYHIAHPIFWKDANGNQPAVNTLITHADYVSGKYRPADSTLDKRVEDYLINLETRGRYVLTIWPPHCLLATPGACVEEQLLKAVRTWEQHKPGRITDFVTKASNPMTEHYSAIQAEVPDPADPSTRINFNLIDKLKNKDIVVAGEALSHCISHTIRDLCVYIPASRITLLTDCTSNVEGFDDIGNHFLIEYKNKGMKTATSTEFTL